MSIAPLEIRIYNKAFQRVGWLGDPTSVIITPRHLAVGACEVTVPSDHRKLPILTAKGARIAIDYQGETILSGVYRGLDGTGGKFSGSVTARFESDERLPWCMLGWPVPANGLASQTTYSDVREGPAETVFKGYVAANAARLGIPVTVAPDLGRGTVIKPSARMSNLGDLLVPKLIKSGIGFSVRQTDDATLLADCYETNPYARELTEDSGIVQSWSWSVQGPTLTRAVVGGQGEGTGRAFTQVTDAVTESDWGDIIEGFVDARDLANPADLPARGQEAITEGRALAGLAVELSETANFQYGKSIRVGDQVILGVGQGVTVSDTLSEASITWDRETGFTATPVVGERSDNQARKFVQMVAGLTRTVKKLTTTT